MNMEKRYLAVSEVRASKSGKTMKVGGYAARYGILSHSLGNFKERISKRAFDGILSTKPDVVCLFNHDANAVLGRTTSGTLQLRADDKGLAFDCDLPDTNAGRDAYESVSRGDIQSCSFAFSLGEPGTDDEWFRTAGELPIRTINNFRALHDVSIVTSPAYPGTQVDARSTTTAEVRSYADRIALPKTSECWKRIFRNAGAVNGVCMEDAIENMRLAVRRRRNELFED
jgi:uncharacterized protein